MTKFKKPEVGELAQMQLDKAEKQFEEFNENVKSMTFDELNKAPKADQEMQTQMSSNDSIKLIYRDPYDSGVLAKSTTLAMKFAHAQAILQDTVIRNPLCTRATNYSGE